MRPTTKLLLDLTFDALEKARAEYRRQVATGTEETIRYARDVMDERRRDLERAQKEAANETFW